MSNRDKEEIGEGAKGEMLAVVPSLFDVVMGRFKSKPVPRIAGDPPSKLHLVVGIFVFNSSTKKFLVQKRSRHKSWYPNFYTDSASGHIMYQAGLTLETIKAEALRELEEEMGLRLSPVDAKLLTLFFDPEFNEIKLIFVAMTGKTDLIIDDDEVEYFGSGWFSSQELLEMLERKKFVPPVVGIWKALVNKARDFNRLFDSLTPWQEYWKYFNDLERFRKDSRELGLSHVPLFIGRFQPFHDGHLDCLREIRKVNDRVIIGIGSPQYSRTRLNPLDLSERKEMIESVLKAPGLDFSDAYIIPIPDVHCEDLWMLNVKMMFGGASNIVLYSNNDWVRGLASQESISLAEKWQYRRDALNGTRIRELIRDGGKWNQFVPRETENFLKARALLEKF
ncbi:MAG: adenylyltransferase/cytidyltransferase family protein [Promethearchaeota archaeon]